MSLERDRIADPRDTFTDVIKKGSSGFRTAVVPKEWGGRVSTLSRRRW
jgi:hypothetical protein